MKRRDFMSIMGHSALAAAVVNGCSETGPLPDSRHLVETPEKRAEYLATMLKRLCADLGPRPSGSAEYNTGAQIILKELEAACPVSLLHDYYYESWELLEEPEFVIDGTTLETYAAHGSTSTQADGVHGYLVKEETAGVSYNVVEKTTDAVKAYVIVNSHGRAIPRYVGGIGERHLPVFSIGKQDVPLLETAVEKRLPVYVDLQMRFLPGTASYNIVGTIPGETSEEILFIAHADTVYSSPGANDNTASMITMLMLAHAFSGKKPKRTVTFLATGSEEYGMQGAINYVQHREAQGNLGNIKYIVNFDSLTYGPNLWVTTIDKELQSLIQSIHEELNIKGTPKFFHSSGFQLDAKHFRNTGARAMNINSRGYDEETLHLWHRPEDLPETVHVDCVENSFLVFREYINRVQNL